MFSYALSSTPHVNNSIIWGNTAGISGDNVDNSGTLPVYSYSGLDGTDLTSFNGLDGTSGITTAMLFVAPLPAASAPTTGGNYRLRSSSPAINAGNNALYTAVLGPPTDLAAHARFNGAIDMGAYEY
jgi:hypothetical protein